MSLALEIKDVNRQRRPSILRNIVKIKNPTIEVEESAMYVSKKTIPMDIYKNYTIATTVYHVKKVEEETEQRR